MDWKQIKNAPALGGLIPLAKIIITQDTTITAGYSGLVPERLEIAAGFKLEIAAGAILEIT